MTKLIEYYYNYFLGEKNNGFLLLCSGVCISIMSSMYNKWVNNLEIQGIELLPEEQKLKFWNLACKYQTESDKRIMASQAAYALELMTGKTN